MADTSSNVEFAIGREFHCSMSSWLAQGKASDGYLPLLDTLKVDEKWTDACSLRSLNRWRLCHCC